MGDLQFKGATIATRAASKWGGVMIKLSGLSPCLWYSAFYFNSVVCRPYQSVTTIKQQHVVKISTESS